MIRLPSEIWLRIFAYATSVPVAFETTDPDIIAACALDAHGIVLHTQHRSSMHIKLAISLVCKTWHELGRQFLFDYLLIKNGEQVMALSHILSQNRIQEGLPPTPNDQSEGRRRQKSNYRPGWYTIRLEIALEGCHVWSSSHTHALTSLMQSTPNLKVFSTAFCAADAHLFHSDTYMQSLSHLAFLKCLKRLELRGEAKLIRDVVGMFGGQEGLEVLWILPSRRILQTNGDDEDIHLPSLHTFISSFPYGSEFTRALKTPSLRSVVTENPVKYHRKSYVPDDRIRELGGQLQYLSLGSPLPFNINLILPSCPNLIELVLTCEAHRLQLAETTVPLSTLKRITLHDYPILSVPNEHWSVPADRLKASLSALIRQDIFPALEEVRLLLPFRSPTVAGGLNATDGGVHLWEDWLAECRARGVKVLVSRGAEEQVLGVWNEFVPVDVYFSI
ncbi:hypothetical protein JAAARDRAFT_191169 [Jaapia argillacea MUCL 33604]|uniref:F-box domain-containing protein n=1 Tax=Jaapia argillacea MUCL 33604 TaxID=933084 RepID=A0A067Q4G2_9AGAM|nr:hypothetical protein JAAARDRAFT_191169 [Jaapia argillacea MUCL 33604]